MDGRFRKLLHVSLNASQINDNLSQQISSIFDFWFKQFNYPDINGNPYSLSGGILTYNEALKRKIPEKWKVATLINNPLSKPIEPGVDYFEHKNYLATANIDGTTITDGEYVSYINRETRANMQPKLYSVWFAKMKNSIKHLFVSGKGESIVSKYILSTGFEGLECNDVSFAYMSGVISDPTFEATKDRYSHGATQQSVNSGDLNLYKILIPDTSTLKKYAEIANPIYEKLNFILVENNQLKDLRDTLLPLLLNGQVSVR